MRNLLAGIFALFTGPMYEKEGIHETYAVLFQLALAFYVLVLVFYYKGAAMRARSPFATKLATETDEEEELTGTTPARQQV